MRQSLFVQSFFLRLPGSRKRLRAAKIALRATAALVCLSCALKPQISESTPSRIYDASFDVTYKAATKAFGNLGLLIFKRDSATGYIEGGRRVSSSGSERTGVFLERVGPMETKVSIENNRGLLGYVHSMDWTWKMFAQIERELRDQK